VFTKYQVVLIVYEVVITSRIWTQNLGILDYLWGF